MLEETPQVRLQPDRAYDDSNPADYANAQWRWSYDGFTSPWFTSRQEAFEDAAVQHPGVGIG